MTTYARVLDSTVREVFVMPVGLERVPITQLFNAAAGTWIDITALDPQPAYGWLYDGSNFSESPPAEANEARREWARKIGYSG